MEIEELYTIWKETFADAENENIGHCFNKIAEAYQDSNKHYHNFNHVAELLEQIKTVDVTSRDKLILTYAAFFHDVVYVSGSKINELESSIFANVWMNQLPIEYDLIHPVCAIIEATSNHQAEDELTQLFLDMDLKILASDGEAYDVYAKNIRKEHHRIPNIFFFKGRKKFVTNMLLKPCIFHTDNYRQKYELRARKNLYRELQDLVK